jgi:hypothetical protein
MIKMDFPTGRDIYLEVDGRRLAVVESYRAETVRQGVPVEAFGEELPVGWAPGAARHRLELTRVTACGEAGDEVDFYELKDFSVVVARPDRRIVYTGCAWEELAESAEADGLVLERAVISALGRVALENEAGEAV